MLDAETFDLTLSELIDMLEAQTERDCVPVPHMNICSHDQTEGKPVHLPARGAAIIMSSEDWGEKKTELETACRELGKSCSYDVKQLLRFSK